jgi:cell division transport system ATP-binding protein
VSAADAEVTKPSEEGIGMRGVSFRYVGGSEILKDVSFSLPRGQLAFLIGASGAGKSTLLKLIGLIERPSRGEVTVNGVDLVKLRKRQVPAFRRQVGMVFQNPALLHRRTVFDNVALPLLIAGLSGTDVGRRVRAALDAVGLLSKERAYPLTLSGGEQQRVGIARAVVARPALLLADEPTGNLDPGMANEVMKLLLRFNEVGVSVLIATHAIAMIRRLSFPILRLDDGRVAPVPADSLGEPSLELV